MLVTRRWLLLLALTLAAGFSACSTESADSQKITLGAVLPLTGDASLYGENTRKGIELAVEQVNQAGGIDGGQVEVIFEDSKAQARDGVSAARKLISQNSVPVIFDDAVSSVALAVVPIIDSSQVVMISSGSTNPELSGATPYFFRTWNSDTEEGRFSAEFARNELNLSAGCALHVDNDYGRGLFEVFKENFEANGGRIVAAETFLQGDSDFRDQIVKLKDAGGEFIYLISYPEKIPIMLQQMRQYGLKHKVLGTVTMEDPEIPKQAGEAAEGVVFPYPVEPTGDVRGRFRQAFESKFGHEPGICSPEGYDNAMLALDALQKGARSGAEIAQHLREVKDWPGASGPITFDENGDVHKPMSMKVIRNGQFVIWEREE